MPEATAAARLPRAVREREILRAATSVFSQHGYHETSMDEVAERAGISKPMVYAYFGSKQGLYLACIRATGTVLREGIAKAAGEGMPVDRRLWQGGLAFFKFVARQPDGWRVLYREASAEGGQSAAEVAGMRRDVVRLVARLLAEAAAESESHAELAVEPLAHALVGASESLANWWADHPEEPPERLAQHLVDLAWAGLGDLLEGRGWTPERAAPARAAGR